MEVSQILVGAAGIVVGALVTFWWRYSERSQVEIPQLDEPEVPPEIDTVLSVLRSSAVVMGQDEKVLRSSAPAVALGLVSGDHLRSSSTSFAKCAATERFAKPNSRFAFAAGHPSLSAPGWLPCRTDSPWRLSKTAPTRSGYKPYDATSSQMSAMN